MNKAKDKKIARCEDCRKYLTGSCELTKAIGELPGPDDYCKGWRAKNGQQVQGAESPV